MPSKRTNDSVDAILQELDHRQTADNVQGSIADRQVDDILRSVGVLNDHIPVGQFGPVDISALPADHLIGEGLPVAEDRFSTAALDDLLGDLPSFRETRRDAAQKEPVLVPARSASAEMSRTAAPARPAPAASAQPVTQPAAPAARPGPAAVPTPVKPVRTEAPRTAAPARPTPAALVQPVQRNAAPAARPARQTAQPAAPAAGQPPVQPVRTEAPRTAAPARPTPAAPAQPVQRNAAPAAAASVQPVQRNAAPAPEPAAPVQPDARTEAAAQPAGPDARQLSTADDMSTTGDTTRTGIIKNFLRKMGGEEADQSALNQGKNQFQRFFEESAAVLPDEKGHLQNPAKKKRGFLGLGSVEDTDDFVPINVSLTANRPEPPEPEERAKEEPPKKRGFFARLFGGKEEPGEELYIPESREEDDYTEVTSAGIVLDEVDTGTLPDIELPREATMQLPKGSTRSKYTAGPGAGLSQSFDAIPLAGAVQTQTPAPDGFAEVHTGTTGEVTLGAPPAADDDILSGILPGDSTLAFLQQAMEAKPAPAQPARTEQSTVYRSGGGRRGRHRYAPAAKKAEPLPAPARPMAEPLPEAYGVGPVGEPLMTTRDDIPAAPAQPEPAAAAPEPAAPPAAPAAYDAPESTGFTVQMDVGGAAEDTAMFLSAYRQARDRRRPKTEPAAAPQPETPEPQAEAGEPQTLEPIDERPTVERVPAAKAGAAPAPDQTQTQTGVVRLAAPADAAAPAGAAAADGLAAQALSAARAAAQPSDFVRNIAQSINDDTAGRPSVRLGDTTGDASVRDADFYRQAAEILTDTNSEVPPAVHGRGPQLDGTPADEVQETATMPPFTAAPRPTRHAYDKPDDAPAVHKDLERQVLVLTVSAIVSGVIALVLLFLGTSALSGGWLPAGLEVSAGKTPLLVVHLVLLVAAMGICWRTMLEGAVGLMRSPSPDTMAALAAFGALVQLVVLLVHDAWYDPTKFGLVTGLAVLVLCMNTVGKAMDAKTLLGGFELVSAKVEHAVAYRLKDSSMLRAATRGLAEGRPCVLVSRPTELFKGFLANASAHRTSDKNQQQFAWALGVCALLALAFNLAYHRDVGLAVSAFAAVLCLGAPLAGTLISALPARLMQRSAARIGAVIPGWRDIRLLGRINVIRITARDLFPEGCVKLCGIKPVRKEDIDRAIIYAASMLADGCPTLREVFLGMIGDNRKLLAQVDDFESVYGKGYIGWIGGERVLMGSRALMEDYGVRLPSLEYEQKHTVNQRRVVYLAVSGQLFSMFQIAYQRDTDTAYVLDSLRRTGISLVVDGEDFNCDAVLLEAVYSLPAGTAKVLSAEERTTLEPATAWLPESEGSMLHLGSFASFVGGLEAAAGAAEGEKRASAVLTGAVLLSCVLGLVLSITGGIVSLPLPAMVLYQAAWAVLALVFPLLQHY